MCFIIGPKTHPTSEVVDYGKIFMVLAEERDADVSIASVANIKLNDPGKWRIRTQKLWDPEVREPIASKTP